MVLKQLNKVLENQRFFICCEIFFLDTQRYFELCLPSNKGNSYHLVTEANLIVATVNNNPAICMSVEKAAKALIKGGEVSDGLLNMVEMAFRPYEPCHACARHALPGEIPLVVNIYNSKGELVERLEKD